MMIESPIRILACMTFPSGSDCLESSFALNAFLYQSSASAAPSIERYGVTLLNPGGIAGFDFFDLAFAAFLLLLFLDFDGIICYPSASGRNSAWIKDNRLNYQFWFGFLTTTGRDGSEGRRWLRLLFSWMINGR